MLKKVNIILYILFFYTLLWEASYCCANDENQIQKLQSTLNTNPVITHDIIADLNVSLTIYDSLLIPDSPYVPIIPTNEYPNYTDDGMPIITFSQIYSSLNIISEEAIKNSIYETFKRNYGVILHENFIYVKVSEMDTRDIQIGYYKFYKQTGFFEQSDGNPFRPEFVDSLGQSHTLITPTTTINPRGYNGPLLNRVLGTPVWIHTSDLVFENVDPTLDPTKKICGNEPSKELHEASF